MVKKYIDPKGTIHRTRCECGWLNDATFKRARCVRCKELLNDCERFKERLLKAMKGGVKI